MPRYSFKAYDSSGRLDSGEIDAEDERTALNLISKRGLFPLEIVAGEASSPETGRWWRRELGGRAR
jgi:type II secretory pathway component PulF